MKTHLNLLPWRFRRRIIVRTRCREWAVGLALACCLPATWCFYTIVETRALLAELESVEEEATPFRNRLLQNEKLNAEMRRAGSRKELVTALRTTRSPLQLLGLLSEHAWRSNGAVQVRGLQFIAEHSGSDVVTESGGTLRGQEERLRIGVQGVAIDDQAVSRFVQSLRTTGLFAALELRQTGDREIEQARVREFSIECSFPVEATRVADRTRVTR
jgi:hypothetical protein